MIPHIKTNNTITLQYEGKMKIIPREDERFEKVLGALKEGRDADIPGIVEPELCLKAQGLTVEDGLVKVGDETIPSELNSRILELQKQSLPFKPLLAFWENLKQNPSFNSRQQLFKFLENQGHPITEDGHFIGYRGVTDDFKDKHSRTFDNSPGSVCRMPREAVDDNPNNTCSHGLHVGSHGYAKSFGPKLVLVKVNPKDVVSVPNDYNGQKMRVCEFTVLREADALINEPVVAQDGNEYTYDDEEFYDSKTDDIDNEDAEYTQYVAEDGKVVCGACGEYEEPLNDNGLCDGCNEHEKKKQYVKNHERYANNHNKRDKSGRFVSKKRKG